MSNRNFDFSAIVKILNAQNNANYYNRQQTVVQAQTSGIPYTTELQQFNPQTGNYDADTIATLQAGQQAYYFKGLPITTVLAPQQFTTNTGSGGSGPAPDAPVLTSVTPGDTSLSVAYSPAGGTPPITNYLYSTDGGTTFTAFSPASTANPLTITGLTNGQTYTVVLQAVSSNGTSVSSNSLTGTPTDTTSFIYSFVYSGAPIDVLTRIPVITTGAGGTLTISSSFTQVGTTYTITVSLISFIDNGSTTKGISFNSSAAVNNFYKVIPVTIEQFGSIPLSRVGSVFINLAQLTISPTTIPVILPTTSFVNLFFGCTDFNSNISGWNTANVTNMAAMFRLATAFNQNIGSWNTSAVSNMARMFQNATAFNQNIGSWNTASVLFMSNMFESATAFNQPIGTWNTAKVTAMDSMFRVASAFNQPIGDWNTTLVMNMQAMFNLATSFNQNISYQVVGPKWNTAAVTNMAAMFSSATVFNNGQAPGGATAPLGWLTTGVTLPIATFRTSSALTNANNVNSATPPDQIGGPL